MQRTLTKCLKQSMLLLNLLILSGCGEIVDQTYYYGQIAAGQINILLMQKPIQDVINNPKTADTIRNKLQLVLDAREFARDALHLPVGKTYLNYVDLQRDAAVWNIFAVPELSLNAKTWCQPFLGCVAYRAYFKQIDAVNYAEFLKQQGFDTSVGGIDAYSTLGLINDPVFNTFLVGEDARLVALIFHEISHKLLYASGDTTFNESFAMTVEFEGLERWANLHGQTDDYQQYLLKQTFSREVSDLLLQYQQQLQELYASSQSDAEKRLRKQDIFDKFSTDYDLLRVQWSAKGITGRDFIVNNALFARTSAYYSLLPKFREILDFLDNDLVKFYDVCKLLEAMSFDERQDILKSDAAAIIDRIGYQPTVTTDSSPIFVNDSFNNSEVNAGQYIIQTCPEV